MFKMITLSVLVVLSYSSIAGTEEGLVRFGLGQYNSNETSPGFTFFYLDGGVKIDTPVCSSYHEGERWVINNSWPAAELQMSILMAAFLSSTKVKIRGSNNCGVYSDTETALDIILIK